MNTCPSTITPTHTIKQALEFGREVLNDLKSRANAEALMLLQHATGNSKEKLIAYPEQILTDKQYREYRQLLQRRFASEPIAYIVGKKEFWSLPLSIDTGILIPRPETELVVEKALEKLSKNHSAQVLDLGTGSGCIALAIAKERPNATVIGCDDSILCIKTAKRNANQLEINNVSFVLSDWFNTLERQTFDVIVSNPPYIAEQDMHLEDAVRKYEPRQALVAKQNGLADLNFIIQHACAHLNSHATLILEHGWQQGVNVRKQLEINNYQDIETFLDFQGHERVTVASRKK